MYIEIDTLGGTGVVVPAVVESGPFTSELVLTNTAGFDRNLKLTLVADGIGATDSSATATLALPGNSQLVVDDVVDWIRQRTTGVPPKGSSVAGALFVTGATPSDSTSWVVASARTSAPGAVGRYGLFYLGSANTKALREAAWIDGLRQDAENRTNLALVNTGYPSASGSDTFAIDVYDGATGSLAGTLPSVTLGPRRWTQIPMVLTQLSRPVSHGYVKVRRTSGSNYFLGYAVINDGAGPGQRSGDGAFLAAQPDCVYERPDEPSVPGRTGGTFTSSMVLASGCPWVATPTVPWITISNPGSGTSSGSFGVTYSVAKNEAPSLRTGQIAVGGTTIEVIQTANAPSPYDGVWSGTTGQGKPISFTVDKGEIVAITLGMSISLSCGQAVGTYTKTITAPNGIYRDAFSTKVYLSLSGTGSPSTLVTGSFSSATQAAGSFSVSSITSGSTQCIVIGSKPGSSWTATRQ